jgi:hypothetical protein
VSAHDPHIVVLLFELGQAKQQIEQTIKSTLRNYVAILEKDMSAALLAPQSLARGGKVALILSGYLMAQTKCPEGSLLQVRLVER